MKKHNKRLASLLVFIDARKIGIIPTCINMDMKDLLVLDAVVVL